MALRVPTAFVVLLVSLSGTWSQADESSSGSKFTLNDAQAFVDYHNRVRKRVGVGEVRWSEELAKYAQEWADHLAETGEFLHRPSSGEWAQDYGENLAIHGSIIQCAEAWASEQEHYPETRPTPADFAEFKAGHYTQMVWQSTKRIGAGVAIVRNGQFAGLKLVVCNYDPAGNIIGEKPYANLDD